MKRPSEVLFDLFDERESDFLAVVDCDPENIIDTQERWKGRQSTGAPKPGEVGSDEIQASIKIKTFEMPFGKHRGKLLSDVPTGYLKWCCNNVGHGIKKLAKAELKRRKS